MNEQDKLELPKASYEIIAKVLHAYAVCGDKAVSLSEVASKASMDPTNVSRNNGFLLSLNLLEGGQKKKLSPLGKELAIALGHDMEDDIRAAWAKAITGNAQAIGIVDMLKVQRSVPKDQFPAKVASSLGLVSGRTTTLGVNTLIDILVKSELVLLQENTYLPAKITSEQKQTKEEPIPQHVTDIQQPAHPSLIPPVKQTVDCDDDPTPSVHIDIQVHISPDAGADQIDQIFSSMAKHLYRKKAK